AGGEVEPCGCSLCGFVSWSVAIVCSNCPEPPQMQSELCATSYEGEPLRHTVKMRPQFEWTLQRNNSRLLVCVTAISLPCAALLLPSSFPSSTASAAEDGGEGWPALQNASAWRSFWSAAVLCRFSLAMPMLTDSFNRTLRPL